MSILIMLILLSILILVHEAGHFLAARAFGIKVEKFGFGLPIGPTLFERKIGGVTVLIHAFLLGGYVAFPDDEKDCDLPADSKDRFLNKPIYQRAIVVSAGVVSNVICAYLIVLFAAFHWGYLPAGKYDVYINNISENATPSLIKSGIKSGDKIVAINNVPITNTGSIVSIISNSKSYDGMYSRTQANKKLLELKNLNIAFTEDEIIPKGITVKLPKCEKEVAVTLTKEMEQGIIRYKSNEEKLDEDLIKLRNKLKKNKLNYYESDGKYSLADISKAISDNNHPIWFTIQRGDKIIKLNRVYADKDGKLGIELAQKEILNKTKGIKSVVKEGTKYLWYNTYNMCYGLGQIFTGKVPLKDLHGIVAITKIGGDIIENSGIYYGLLLTAIISMDLAIVNFLPIPALDGGHVLFLIIEKIRGRRLKDETVEKIGTFFFALLIVLMVVIIFNDIMWLKG